MSALDEAGHHAVPAPSSAQLDEFEQRLEAVEQRLLEVMPLESTIDRHAHAHSIALVIQRALSRLRGRLNGSVR